MANLVVNIGQLPNGTAKTVLGVNASGAAVQVPVGAVGQSLVQAPNVSAALGVLGLPSGSALGFRNRIINGDFRLDNYALGSIIPLVGKTYITDRWMFSASVASKFVCGRYSISTLAGFPFCLGATSSSAYTLGAGDAFGFGQPIEGLNVADLAFGSASASAFTISFWAHSDIAGTYSGSIRNSAANRSYVFSYQISAASTWQKISITIPGDTSGAWAADNSVGMYVMFSLGAGSSLKTAAGSWVAGNYVAATGATDVVATNNSHLFITGIQGEPGNVATPFEFRPISTELQLCQRYYWRKGIITEHFGAGNGTAPGVAVGAIAFPVPMRAFPTLSCNSPVAGNFNLIGAGGGYLAVSSLVFNNASLNSAWWTAKVDTAYMSGGQGTFLWSNAASAFISASAEL